MLSCIRCLKYSWTDNNPLCTKCAGRVEISSVSDLMLKALEKLPKVTLEEVWRSANKRILAFEHYDLIDYFDSERVFAEYLSLVEIQERTGDKIDLDIVEDEYRWRSLSYALTYEAEDAKVRKETTGYERRIQPYKESDDRAVDVDEIMYAHLKHVNINELKETSNG